MRITVVDVTELVKNLHKITLSKCPSIFEYLNFIASIFTHAQICVHRLSESGQ